MALAAQTRRVVVASLREAARVLSAEKLKSKTWETLTVDELAKDPKLVDRVWDLIKTAYGNAPGGNLKLKNPHDLLNGDVTLFHLKDRDGDGLPEEAELSREEPDGEKTTAIGHDGSKEAKKDVFDHLSTELRQPGHYAEVSEAAAHVLLTKYKDVPIVEDQKHVESALRRMNPDEYHKEHGKCPKGYNWDDTKRKCKSTTGEPASKGARTVEWHGAHPEGKYPGTKGWYSRDIGGHKSTKILLGIPKHGTSETKAS